MTMTDAQPIRFSFAKINTDEFALPEKNYDTAIPTTMKLAIVFAFVKAETSIGVQTKFLFYQGETLLLVIAVTCWFKIQQEDWDKTYQGANKTVVLSRPHALHLASLTVGTARGVLHSKTEGTGLNTLLIPPVNLNDIIKENVTILETL
jgi:hypothetical protein